MNFRPQIEVEFNNKKDVNLSFGGQIGEEEIYGGGILFCNKNEKYLGGLSLHYQSDWGLELEFKGCRNYEEKSATLKVKYNIGKVILKKEDKELELEPYLLINYTNDIKSIHIGNKHQINKEITVKGDIGIDNNKRLILGNEIDYQIFDHTINFRNEIKLSRDNIEYNNESKFNFDFDLDKLGF